MAIQYGSEVRSNADTRLRLGYEFSQSPATVTSSTGLVTVTCKLYAQSYNAMWDTAAPLAWSGSFGSGSTTVDFRTSTNGQGWTSSNVRLLRTLTRTVTASEAAAIKTSISASFKMQPTISAAATVSGTWYTAKKPQSIFPPESIVDPMTVESMTADGTCVMNWSRVSPNDPSKPYVNIDIQMWTPDTGTYNALATTGNTSTFTIQRMADFSLYRFRARPRNSAGAAAAWAYTPFVYTEPDAPRNVRLKANADGTVTVTWDAPAKVPDTSYYAPKYEVVRRLNQGAWEYSLAAEVSTRSWTHTNVDPSTEYQYAVRTVGRTSPDVVLYSPYVQSTYIRLSAPPLTPIIAGPTEGQRFGVDFSLWWEHNPQDGSEQSGYELEWWTGKDTTVRSAVQTASAWNKFVIRPPQDNDYVRWRVRTKGVHPDFSPWSAVQVVGVSTPPTVTLVTTPGPYWGQSPTLRATWTYTDPAGQRATKYEVKSIDASGEIVRQYVGDTAVASGGTAWATFVTPILNGETLTVSVRVADLYGVFSDWSTATVTADYAEPVKPAISAVFNEETGTATVTVTSAAPGPGVPATALYELFVYRRAGQWEMVATAANTRDFVWEDPAPYYGSGTHNLYAVRATSDYPSYTVSNIALLQVNPVGCDQWFWLSSASDTSKRARFRGNPKVQDTSVTLKNMRRFYGDKFPTEFSTDMVERTVNVSGILDRSATSWQEWIDLSQTPGTVIYRDPHGRRLRVSLGGVTIDHAALMRYESVSFPLTVTEDVQGPLWMDVVAEQRLVEYSAGLWQLVEESGVDLEERSVGLWELTTDPARTYFIEVSEGLWAYVNADEPERVW